VKDGEVIQLANEKSNSKDSIVVHAPAKNNTAMDKLEFAGNATDHQIMVRNAWLGSMANKPPSTN